MATMEPIEGQGGTNGHATWTSTQCDQVKNHLKTWSRKFEKLNKLRKLSAAGWDETNFIITLDEEHYNNYVAVHKSDAEYLNMPLEH